MSELQQRHAEALATRATCPTCGSEGNRVHAQFLQATRSEPMRFLGFQGYCHDCDCRFKAEAPQLTLV